MSRLECDTCGEMVDVSNRTLALPFVCDTCTSPNDPSDNYVIECRHRYSRLPNPWSRSENEATKCVFDDYSTALEAAEREQDGSFMEYRVVALYTKDVPCRARLTASRTRIISRMSSSGSQGTH